MIKDKKNYPNPKFSSLKEEDEYWKTHSPLDEGYDGKVQKAKQKRTSFLSIRLTGEEITELRNIAAKLGMGPSTFIRQLLKLTMEQAYPEVHSPSSFLTSPYLFSSLYDSSESFDHRLKQIGQIERAFKAYINAEKELLKAYQEYKQNVEQTSV
jgi:predicted DNA binding CopG/RHH family protein